MRKQKKYSFYEKGHSKRGKVSLAMCITAIVLFVVTIIISFITGGGSTIGNAAIGGISLIAVLLSVYGFAVGMISLRENDTNHLTGIIGSIGSGVLAVLWLTMFLRGIG